MFDGFDNYDTVSEPSWNICVYIDTKFSSTARILKQNIKSDQNCTDGYL